MLHVSLVVMEAAPVPVPAHVPPFLHLCILAAVGLLLAGIAPVVAGW